MSAYENIVNNLPTFTEREVVRKSEKFKAFNNVWNTKLYNQTGKVGFLMKAIGEYSSTIAFEDFNRSSWVAYYFERVRSPEQVEGLVTELSENEGLDFKTALTYWWIYVLDNTFIGEFNELACLEYLKEYAAQKDYTVRRSTDDEDRHMGVDAVVSDLWGRVIIGVQFKPSSYFFTKSQYAVRTREEINPAKYRKFTEENDAPVWYVVVNKTMETGKLVWLKAKY